jgi:DNA uptake protein ComE-like DNA-binding protein
VRAGTRWTVVGLMILCTCVCVHGQNQDRDSRGAPKTSASAPPPEERVDINHASSAELLKIPGITLTWADRIIRYRPYHSKADLWQRGIVPDAVYDRIKDYVIAHREK